MFVHWCMPTHYDWKMENYHAINAHTIMGLGLFHITITVFFVDLATILKCPSINMYTQDNCLHGIGSLLYCFLGTWWEELFKTHNNISKHDSSLHQTKTPIDRDCAEPYYCYLHHSALCCQTVHIHFVLKRCINHGATSMHQRPTTRNSIKWKHCNKYSLVSPVRRIAVHLRVSNKAILCYIFPHYSNCFRTWFCDAAVRWRRGSACNEATRKEYFNTLCKKCIKTVDTNNVIA